MVRHFGQHDFGSHEANSRDGVDQFPKLSFANRNRLGELPEASVGFQELSMKELKLRHHLVDGKPIC